MIVLRRRLRFFAWFALMAVAGLSFAPTVSRVLLTPERDLHPAHVHPAGSAMALPMPMAAGTMDAPAAAPPPTPRSHELSLEHCDMCAVAAAAYTVAPTTPLLAPAAAAEVRAPVGSQTSAESRVVWVAARPRGPPPRG